RGTSCPFGAAVALWGLRWPFWGCPSPFGAGMALCGLPQPFSGWPGPSGATVALSGPGWPFSGSCGPLRAGAALVRAAAPFRLAGRPLDGRHLRAPGTAQGTAAEGDEAVAVGAEVLLQAGAQPALELAAPASRLSQLAWRPAHAARLP